MLQLGEEVEKYSDTYQEGRVKRLGVTQRIP